MGLAILSGKAILRLCNEVQGRPLWSPFVVLPVNRKELIGRYKKAILSASLAAKGAADFSVFA